MPRKKMLNGVARHRCDLPQHLLDAEIDQHLAQIKVEELRLHEGIG